MFIQLNPIEDFSVIGGNVADSGLINGDFDGFAKSKVANVVSLGGVPRFKPFLLLLLVEPTQALAHKHHIFAITIGTVFLLSLEPPNPQLQRITVRQSGMLASVGLSVAGAGPDYCSVDSLIIGVVVSLGGDVVVEVGEDDILVVDFLDDFSGLLNCLDDEVDLVIDVFDLADFHVDEVVFEHLLAATGVLLGLLLQLRQLDGGLQVVLKVAGILLEEVELGLDLLVLRLLRDNLFGHEAALVELVGDSFHQLLVFSAVHPVVLGQHEHVPPAVLFVPPQLLVLRLQSFDL